jgi:predicted nucleic acid-binding protein
VTVFLDTNILIYSVSDHPDERRKRDIAIDLIDTADCVLSVQVLQEFYFQVTRPSRPTRLPPAIAAGFVRSWMRFRIEENTPALLMSAMALSQDAQLSIWDALVVAAAQSAGCETLMTEDLSHRQRFGSVQIRNPFR